MSETNGKTKTSELMIIVNGPADKPYYSIRYYDLSDNEWHIGFSSYYLQNVINWKNECFEIIGGSKDSDKDVALQALLSALSEVSKYIDKDKLISALRDTGEGEQPETAVVDDTNKYIDKDALVSDLKAANESDRMVYMGVFDIINSQPIVEAKEVRHGKWIIKNNERHWQDKDHYSLFITCSECGLTHFLGTTRYKNEYNEQKFKDNNYDKYLFCRKCGARMDKE